MNAEIFSAEAKSVYHNGVYWIAGGEGSNTMAYSMDGTKWIPIKEGVFSDMCMSIRSNKNTPLVTLKSYILAFGEGANTIAKSTDGINWTGLGKVIFTEYGKNGFWN